MAQHVLAVRRAELEPAEELQNLLVRERDVDFVARLAADFEDQNVETLPKLASHEFLAAHLGNIGMNARNAKRMAIA